MTHCRLAYTTFALLLAACTSSSSGGGAPGNDGGPDTSFGNGDAGGDGTAPGDDSGTDSASAADTAPGNDGAVDSGSGGDGSMGSDSAMAGDSAMATDSSEADSNPDAADLCAALQGNFQATAVSCNGTPVSLGSLVWTASVSGTSGSFTETILGCSLIESGTVSCDSSTGIFTVVATNPNQCSPASCSPFTSQCGATSATQVWQIGMVTSTTFVATSQNQPDGGPTPIQTCTAQGKMNPVQVTWTKM